MRHVGLKKSKITLAAGEIRWSNNTRVISRFNFKLATETESLSIYYFMRTLIATRVVEMNIVCPY